MNSEKLNEPLSLADSFASKKQTPKKKRNFFNIQEGDNVYLPLPPYGRLATEGRWIVKNPVHWGLVVDDARRPFLCPGFGCAKCAYDKGVKAALEKLDPKTDPELYALLKGYTEVHTLNVTYDMNVLSQTNQIGLLKIRSKMFQSLVVEEGKVAKYGIKFASVNNGTWINFHKQGKGATGVFTATALREDKEVEGTVAQVLRKTPISQEVLNRMQEEAFDLDRIATPLTFEQVKTIVDSIQDYEVDQDVVNHVFKSVSAQTTSESVGSPPSASKNSSDPLAKYF